MFGILDYIKLALGAVVGGFVVYIFMSLITVPSAEHRAREGYVQLAEKTTAEAKAAEMERQRNAASQALDEARKRQAADEVVQQAKDAQTDTEVADYEKKLAAANRQCLADPDDVDFLLKH
ncbi:hypothetical protein [Rhizobium rhizogenes]|uniref:hypothetical protein n=1 Tax=Rhizobium rhizogenes TaxID=359 RepID=UPI001571B3FC|nr:hypothetical protein [Rhizobium rhizogenes]NTG61850.1 hypothetical protein [Rhizobium rhizogenes]NTG94264.1 hypothetical protein [Rhizobium rhizogenes]NTH97054.1 hypothetical protein [Rhizobium rhizogenes]NTJ15240.1 hypothetical protein [Rhizobium rhizogenes]